MPIRAACQCGKAFAAPDNLAGKTVKCPGCGQPLKIPAAGGGAPAGAKAPAPRPATPPQPAPFAGGLGDLLDEAGITQHAGPRCPACDSPVPPQALICTKCGFNRQTGVRTTSEVSTGGKHVGHGDAADALLAQARKEVEAAPVHTDDKEMGGVASVWTWVFVLFLPILFASGFAIAILWGGTLAFPAMIVWGAIQADSYWYIIPALVIGAGILLTAFGWLNVTSVALDRNVWHGILCMFLVGSYCYYWGLFNWKWSRSAMMTYFSGIWLLNFGSCLFFMFIFFEVGLYIPCFALLIMYVAQLVAFIGATGVTLVAIEESLGQGLACVLTGIYTLIYGFMRWAQCKVDMIIFLVGCCLAIVSAIVFVVGFAAHSGKFNERMKKAMEDAQRKNPEQSWRHERIVRPEFEVARGDESLAGAEYSR